MTAQALARRLAEAVILFTMVQIILGAVVRLTDSGLACPDWPLCYGLWLPTPDKIATLPDVAYSYGQIMAEWLHRLNAALFIGPLTLALAVAAWGRADRASASGGRPRRVLVIAAVVVLLVQAGLGGLTVLDRNSPWSVAVHLSTALLFLALVIWLRLALNEDDGDPGGRPGGRPGGSGLLVLVILAAVTASGAMMAKSGASLGCSEWPLCEGRLIPDMSDPAVRLHMIHRLLALAGGFAVIAFAWHRRLLLPAALLVVQIGLGAGVVHVFAGPALAPQVAIGAAHQGLAVVLFALVAIHAWRPAPAGARHR